MLPSMEYISKLIFLLEKDKNYLLQQYCIKYNAIFTYGDNIQAEKSNKHECLHFGKCNITTEDTTGVFYKVCLDETCGILS